MLLLMASTHSQREIVHLSATIVWGWFVNGVGLGCV